MLIQPDFTEAPVKVHVPKRMMEVIEDSGLGKPLVKINSSSMSVIQECKRKALYNLEHGYRSENEGEALIFGKAIHRGIEVWYANEKNESLALEAFHETAKPLALISDKDKRHPSNGEKILKKYFKTYATDSMSLLCDEQGPILERDMEVLLADLPFARIYYFGTVDRIMTDAMGMPVVVDTKTTSSLGSDFYNRIHPNHQFVGYALLARHALGLDVSNVMVDGIQVAKTKWDLVRHTATITDDDVEEFKDAVSAAVSEYLRCRETGIWPMTAPNPCAQWGGCQYRQVCEVPKSLKPEVLSNLYPQGALNGEAI